MLSPLIAVTLFGWIPFVAILFLVLPPARAVIAAFLTAWLFLPMYGYQISGLPDYTKMSATCVGVLLAASIFDAGTFARFRPAWHDLPMVMWCILPLASSVTAGYGWYEGLGKVLDQVITWGFPYLIGRLYINNLAALRDLAVGVVIGGLIYVPLCLYEVKFSPRLHVIVYGFHQHSWDQSRRGGGMFGMWRPTVFMQHGLAVGMFMGTSALAAVWLWMSRAVKRVMGLPIELAAIALLVTTIFVKSTGATALTFMGISVLIAARVLNSRLPVIPLLVSPILYVLMRLGFRWSGEELVSISRLVSQRAAESMKARLDSEEGLWTLTQGNLMFGRGRFDYAGTRLNDDTNMVIPDGLWMITLAKFGLVGVAILLALLLVPAMVFVWRYGPKLWRHTLVAPALGWAVILALYLCDCLMNAMVNPIFLLAAGGLAAVKSPEEARRAWRVFVMKQAERRRRQMMKAHRAAREALEREAALAHKAAGLPE